MEDEDDFEIIEHPDRVTQNTLPPVAVPEPKKVVTQEAEAILQRVIEKNTSSAALLEREPGMDKKDFTSKKTLQLWTWLAILLAFGVLRFLGLFSFIVACTSLACPTLACTSFKPFPVASYSA